MSTEVQIGFPCPHLIVEEPVSLGEDRRSLEPKAPVANMGSVRILIDDALYVPSSGLQSQALLQGGPGPYRIERCVGVKGPDADLLRVKASGGTVEVRLPLGSRIKLDTLLKTLRLGALNDLVTLTSRNGAIAFGDSQSTGSTSFVQVSGKGAAALGFVQLGARGVELYPPWELVARESVYPSTTPRGLIPVPARYPRFRKAVRGNPDIKVTYSAMPERCPRCQATYVENDYRFDLEGNVITIQNEDLLYQACLKALLTLRGSNPYHPAYGSLIMSRVGRKRMATSAVLIQEDVMNCLSRVGSVQQQQGRYQQVKDRERLYQIKAVSLRPSTDDPTVVLLSVSVTNGANKPVALNIVYSAPGAIALAGSNGQSLGVETSGLSRAQSQRFLVDG